MSKYEKQLEVAKSQLNQAEIKYRESLLNYIKVDILPKPMNDQEFDSFIEQKTFWVETLINDTELWSVKESYIKDYQYLEEFLRSLTLDVNYHSSSFTEDQQYELELRKRISLLDLDQSFEHPNDPLESIWDKLDSQKKI